MGNVRVECQDWARVWNFATSIGCYVLTRPLPVSLATLPPAVCEVFLGNPVICDGPRRRREGHPTPAAAYPREDLRKAVGRV